MRSLIWSFAVLAACSSDVALGGPGTLVRVDSEPPGANCPDGGVAIRTGLDQDGDGYLDDNEVTSTQYVCNGSRPVQCGGGTILPGPVSIGNDSELAMLAGVTCVDGDLLITGLTVDSLPQLDLATVTGDIVLAGNRNLGSLAGLDALRELGGTFLIQGNAAITDVATLAGLRRVTSIGIIGNDALVDLHGLIGLQSLNASLTVADNASLATLAGLENVVTADHTLAIRSNPALTSVDALYQLRSVQLLDISNNGKLPAIALPSLETVTVRLYVNNNPIAIVASMPALKEVGDFARFDGNGALGNIDLPALITTGSLYLTNDPTLIAVYAQSLVFSTGEIQIGNVPALRTLDFAALTSIGGSITISDAPRLTAMSAFHLVETIGGTFRINNDDAIRDFSGFDSLKLVSGDMIVTNNAALSTFTGLGALTEIGGSLTITGNPMLPTATSNAFASRLDVHGTITIQ